jgi:hypothetical protein
MGWLKGNLQTGGADRSHACKPRAAPGPPARPRGQAQLFQEPSARTGTDGNLCIGKKDAKLSSWRARRRRRRQRVAVVEVESQGAQARRK